MAGDPLYDLAVEPESLRAFVAELEAAGFERVAPDAWRGPTHPALLERGHCTTEHMTVIIRPSWPYFPPLLHVPGIASWHADRERLCIWQAEDASQRWVTLAGLYARIEEWAVSADAGFATAENARNPEIYWAEKWPICYGLVDLDELVGRDRSDGQQHRFHFVDATSADGQSAPNVLDLRPGPFAAMTGTPGVVGDFRHVEGRCFVRGAVPHPPRTLEEFRSFLTPTQRQALDRQMRVRQLLMFGLVWPNEAGLVATMLITHAGAEGQRENGVVVLRPKGLPAMLLRAGPDAALLQEMRVAVIGVGAIGSHLAEQLTRSGVGPLRLIDYDDLWPVNLIRHAAPPGTPPGAQKTEALAEHLRLYPWAEIETPEAIENGYVWTIPDLRAAMTDVDLLIDATGHGGLAELAARVAADAGCPFLSVALFRGGAVARVRRQATETDTPILHRPHYDGYPEIPPLDEEAEYVGTETGCLAQVHNAPPVAVAHAAALATEVAIDHLTERHEQPDEIIEIIRQGDEPPFDRVGRLRPEDLPATVDITERAQEALRDAARRALPLETGGVIVGCVVDGRPVISEAIEINDPEATTRRYRVPEGRTPEAVAEAQRRDRRVGYVGEWHSHPDGRDVSVLDIATMLKAADDPGVSDPVLVVVHADATPERLSAHVVRAGGVGLRAADLSPTGDLPLDEAAETTEPAEDV